MTRRGKPRIPLRYWALWWVVLLVADVVFDLLLTPIWIGLRTLAWIAEFRARRRQPVSTAEARQPPT